MVRALAVLVFESGRPAPCAAPGAVLPRLRTHAKGVLAFRGDVVSLLNNVGAYTRGFGAPGHAWVFESGGTTVLTSNIVTQGCELSRTVPCGIDDDCGAIALGACVTGGVLLRDMSVASATTRA